MAISTLENFDALSLLDQMEPESLSISDMTLEKQISFLEAFKSWKDVEKGRAKGKGFANATILNRNRDKNVYTRAESEFLRLAESFDVKLAHEFRFTVKDRENHNHTFKLDFYEPISQIDFEISPSFHNTYHLVSIRDKLRELLLKRHHITMVTIKAMPDNKIDINK